MSQSISKHKQDWFVKAFPRLIAFYEEHSDLDLGSDSPMAIIKKCSSAVSVPVVSKSELVAQPSPKKATSPAQQPKQQQQQTSPQKESPPVQAASAGAEDDPFRVDHLVSNSVLEKVKISTDELEQRNFVVEGKMNVLIAMIQQERLSFEQYTEIVNKCIAADKELVKGLLAKGNKSDDMKIERRIYMMQDELVE
jgi:hypothetical protein